MLLSLTSVKTRKLMKYNCLFSQKSQNSQFNQNRPTNNKLFIFLNSAHFKYYGISYVVDFMKYFV